MHSVSFYEIYFIEINAIQLILIFNLNFQTIRIFKYIPFTNFKNCFLHDWSIVSLEPKMFKLVPRSHLAQSFVSTFLYDGCAISSQKKRKNRDRLKFSHHMHQCQTDRLWAQTQCQFYEFRSNKFSDFAKITLAQILIWF